MSVDSVSDIEHLYSPSRWCRRYKTSDECIEDHVKKITEESELARKNIPSELNISYGSYTKEKYDLFGSDLPDNAPIIFYVHGGYWQEKTIGRENSSYIAAAFHKHGIKSFIIGYELCPDVKLEEILEQSKNALRKCLEYARRKGSSGIILIGHSAGAHLVLNFFSSLAKAFSDDDQKLIKSSFLIGGIYNLEPLLQTSYNDPLKLTLDTAKALSLMKEEISGNGTVFFVVVGRNDSPAFVTESEKIAKWLKTQKISAKLHILEDIDHFDIVEKLSDEEFQLTKLILNVAKGI